MMFIPQGFKSFSSMRYRTAAALLFAMAPLVPADAQNTEALRVDAHAPTTPFPHYWEEIFGSGRAILSLRESYRKDLQSVKKVTDFREVRFHAIFHDEVGLYDPDRKPVQFAQMKDA